MCPSTLTIDATVTGYWDQFGKHIQTTMAYDTGIDGRYNYHSFFIFDLTNVSGTITAATLLLQNPVTGFNSANSPLTVTFVNVDTPVDQLTPYTNHTNARVDIWQDLGGMKPDNVVYGAYDATSADNGTIVAVGLMAAAIGDMNAAEGQPIAMGASITNLDQTDNPQSMFYDSRSPRLLRQLVLTINDGSAPTLRGITPGKSALGAEPVDGLPIGLVPPLATALAASATGSTGLSSQALDGATATHWSPSLSSDGGSLNSSGLRHDATASATDGLTDGLCVNGASIDEIFASVR
jgi:hypothetical protein